MHARAERCINPELSARPRVAVSDWPGSYQAVLSLDGRELWQGNRSRVVFLAGVLEEKLGTGHLELAVVRASIAARARARVAWDSIGKGTLRFAVSFGGASLLSVGIEGMSFVPARCDGLLLENHTRLTLELENAQGASVDATVVLMVERPKASWAITLCSEIGPLDGRSNTDEQAVAEVLL